MSTNNSTFNRQQALQRLLDYAKTMPWQEPLHEGNCAHADGSCVKCLRAELSQVRGRLSHALETQNAPRSLPAEFDRLATAIDSAFAARKRMPGIGGQQLGLETYSLRLSGAQYSEVMSNLLDLRNALTGKTRPRVPLRSGEPYSDAEDALVRDMHGRGCTVVEMAASLQRTEPGVQARLEKLGLVSISVVSAAGPERV